MVLICLFLCRSVSLPLFIFPPSSSAYAPILISISSIVLRLISSSLFPSRLHPLLAFQSRRVPPALALPLLFFSPSSSSAYAPILISISSIVLRLISSSLFPSRPHPLPVFQSRRVPPALALPLLFLFLFRPLNLVWPRPSFSFSSGLYFCAPDVLPVANIVFLPPPLDMAKEAICALLAILEHFFEAFSPLDLFFAPAPFRPVPRPFPAFLHPGCHRFPSSPASVA